MGSLVISKRHNCLLCSHRMFNFSFIIEVFSKVVKCHLVFPRAAYLVCRVLKEFLALLWYSKGGAAHLFQRVPEVFFILEQQPEESRRLLNKEKGMTSTVNKAHQAEKSHTVQRRHLQCQCSTLSEKLEYPFFSLGYFRAIS